MDHAKPDTPEKRSRDGVFKPRDKDKWYVSFMAAGERRREVGGRTKAEAVAHRAKRIMEVAQGRYVDPDAARITVNQALDALIDHQRLKGLATSAHDHVVPVRAAFGDARVGQITAHALEQFQKDRLAEGYKPSTVNKQVGYLHQALKHARRQGRFAGDLPYWTRLTENNARQGFFEQDEFEAVHRVLEARDPDVADVALFAYLSGWRKKNILGLRWADVDERGRVIRIATSKNGDPQVLHLDGRLWSLIERRIRARYPRDAHGIPRTTPSEWVFHRRGGRQIKDFYALWRIACREAGVQGKLFYDMKRSAVRDLSNAGVDHATIMSLTGHKTMAIFLRYRIVAGDDQREALRRRDAAMVT